MAPAITLYTAHHCPWAYRVQIALRELALEFETVIIDTTTTRSPDYLAINPRGLVPALVYNQKTLLESGLIVQFLVDTHPGHLLRSSSDAGGASDRYDIGFFIDTYFSKAHPFYDFALYSTGEEEVAAAAGYVGGIIEHVEPLLQNATPFFGGSKKITLAEVMTGSFLLRILALPKHQGILPSFVHSRLEASAPHFWKWAKAVVAQETVKAVWDEEDVVKRTYARIAKERASRQSS